MNSAKMLMILGAALLLSATCAGAAELDLENQPESEFSFGLDGTAPQTQMVEELDVDEQYQIGAGDILILSVWKDAALSRQVSVLPDGTVSFPLIGQVVAQGKTVQALKREVTGKIKKFLPEPVLDVSVVSVNSMLVYVIGKVRAPGRYPVQSNVNVLQALAIAGGLDKHADENDIKIYREENHQTTIFSFEYDDVIDGEHLEQNIRLRRGDVVVVP